MPALSTPLGDEPRFLEPLDDDRDPPWAVRRAAVQIALGGFYILWNQISGAIDDLDRWAGDHDRRADCGEARDDAADDINAMAALLDTLALDLMAIAAASRAVRA